MDRDTERLKALDELKEIHDLISEIEAFWNAPYFDEAKAREIIQKVNDKHRENIKLYNIATYHRASYNASGVFVPSALQAQLQQDLQWKHFYLNAKMCGKAAEVIVKEWKDIQTQSASESR